MTTKQATKPVRILGNGYSRTFKLYVAGVAAVGAGIAYAAPYAAEYAPSEYIPTAQLIGALVAAVALLWLLWRPVRLIVQALAVPAPHRRTALRLLWRSQMKSIAGQVWGWKKIDGIERAPALVMLNSWTDGSEIVGVLACFEMPATNLDYERYAGGKAVLDLFKRHMGVEHVAVSPGTVSNLVTYQVRAANALD